jgi:hypothetical protein
MRLKPRRLGVVIFGANKIIEIIGIARHSQIDMGKTVRKKKSKSVWGLFYITSGDIARWFWKSLSFLKPIL